MSLLVSAHGCGLIACRRMQNCREFACHGFVKLIANGRNVSLLGKVGIIKEASHKPNPCTSHMSTNYNSDHKALNMVECDVLEIIAIVF